MKKKIWFSSVEKIISFFFGVDFFSFFFHSLIIYTAEEKISSSLHMAVAERPIRIMKSRPAPSPRRIERSAASSAAPASSRLAMKKTLADSDEMILFGFEKNVFELISRDAILQYPTSFFYHAMMRHCTLKKKPVATETDAKTEESSAATAPMIPLSEALSPAKSSTSIDTVPLESKRAASSRAASTILTPAYPMSIAVNDTRADGTVKTWIYVDAPHCQQLFDFMRTHSLPIDFLGRSYSSQNNNIQLYHGYNSRAQESMGRETNCFVQYCSARLYNIEGFVRAVEKITPSCRICRLSQFRYESDRLLGHDLAECDLIRGKRHHLHVGSRIEIGRDHGFDADVGMIGGGGAVGGIQLLREAVTIYAFAEPTFECRNDNGDIKIVNRRSILRVLHCGFTNCHMEDRALCPPEHDWTHRPSHEGSIATA